MKKIFQLMVLMAFLFAGLVIVKSSAAYEFPIPELGNCRDRAECHLFCDVPQNKAACWSYSVYGVKNDVLGDEAPEQKLTTTTGITFPIAELGNCANVADCKAFCSQSQNQPTCKSFGQAHGLFKKDRLVELAQTELSCRSVTECREVCQQEANQEKCQEFTKRMGLKQTNENQTLELAKTELGCTNREDCRKLCNLPQNHDKCAAFGRKFNQNDDRTRKEALIELGKTELGCDSLAACRTFCSQAENREKCASFSKRMGVGVREKIKEQGNCSTIAECRKICDEHPDKCPSFPKQKLERGQEKLPLPSGIRTDTPTFLAPPVRSDTKPTTSDFTESTPDRNTDTEEGFGF